MSDPRSARMEQDCQRLAQQNARLAARLAEVEGQAKENGGPLESRIARARASGVPETVIAGLLEDADEVFRAGC